MWYLKPIAKSLTKTDSLGCVPFKTHNAFTTEPLFCGCDDHERVFANVMKQMPMVKTSLKLTRTSGAPG